jgi:hypothetical protein
MVADVARKQRGRRDVTIEELRKLVEEIRQRQSELDNVEVKAAKGGTNSGVAYVC